MADVEFGGSYGPGVGGSFGFDLGGFDSVESGCLCFEFAAREILGPVVLAFFGGTLAQTSWRHSFGTPLFLGVLSCGCQGWRFCGTSFHISSPYT